MTTRVFTTLGLAGLILMIAAGVKSRAQSFNTGSDGSDGALTIGLNQGTIIFDPMDTARWGHVLDADGDGVYNFTTITIGAGSTIKLQGDRVNRPVHWLASGDVLINGTVDLSGAHGTNTSDLSLRRQVAVPGSGGYAGGAGGQYATVPSNPTAPPTPGEGPGGGSGGFACIASRIFCGRGGTFTGNRYLIPLVGGSGGEGGLVDGFGSYDQGGAGGGAILIASSSSITMNGNISAPGGIGNADNGFQIGIRVAGCGSGGAIRLVAPSLIGNGTMNVAGGSCTPPLGNGGTGLVRLEGFQISTGFNFPAGGGFVTRGSPVDAATLRPQSSVRVTAISGVPVAPNPTGSFVVPDVTINNTSAVNVDIQATGIPPGTVVTLQVYPQTPTDLQIVNLPTAQATLSGTLALSTATATFTFPYGFSRGFVRATWTQ